LDKSSPLLFTRIRVLAMVLARSSMALAGWHWQYAVGSQVVWANEY